jgi:hypothetical protein
MLHPPKKHRSRSLVVRAFASRHDRTAATVQHAHGLATAAQPRLRRTRTRGGSPVSVLTLICPGGKGHQRQRTYIPSREPRAWRMACVFWSSQFCRYEATRDIERNRRGTIHGQRGGGAPRASRVIFHLHSGKSARKCCLVDLLGGTLLKLMCWMCSPNLSTLEQNQPRLTEWESPNRLSQVKFWPTQRTRGTWQKGSFSPPPSAPPSPQVSPRVRDCHGSKCSVLGCARLTGWIFFCRSRDVAESD